MTVHFFVVGACFSLVWLSGSACSAEREPREVSPRAVYADTTGGETDRSPNAQGGEPVAEAPGEVQAEEESEEDTVAKALEGRWEARFARSSALIELETSSGTLSGSVHEPGKEPVPIQIGIITSDGFLFETRGDGRCIWIARLADGTLSGRRERVANGLVERFDGYRAGELPTF